MRITRNFNDFFNSEKTGGLLLVICSLISLFLSNSRFQFAYIQTWETYWNGHSITSWINDGLMTIFFLLIGLELKREIYRGELSNKKTAMLPAVAALGGVLVPAGIYLLFNYGTITQKGAGIPIATDIAFAIGILSLLGKKVPPSLKIFLTALAVIDDLVAILVIAIFYTSSISFLHLIIAIAIFVSMVIISRQKVTNIILYLIGGVALWYCLLQARIHPTISGVLVAFTIPFGKGDENSPSYILQKMLHKPVAFAILPLFALVNTCIIFPPNWAHYVFSKEGIGIYAGLVAGKPAGILLFSWIAVMMGICTLPEDLKWKHILGAGLLAGIGFTMSIFITLLAFYNPGTIGIAKIAIILASATAGLLGYVTLRFILKK